MAFYRVHKNDNYTVMSNYHLRDKKLTLKGKGLLSFMLSKKDDWKFSISGLNSELKESKTAISNTMQELIGLGYITRNQENTCGFQKVCYNVFESPIESARPTFPLPRNADTGNAVAGNDALISTEQVNTDKVNTDLNKNKTETSEKEDFREREIEVIEPEDLSKQVKDLQKENSKKVALKKVKEWDQDVLNCTQAITKLFPDHLKPTTINQTQKWIDTIDKLKRIDGVPLKRVYEIVKSVREDDFWSKNFLSLAKLRKKNGDDVMYIVVFNEKFPNAPDKQDAKIEAQKAAYLANSNPNDLM